MELILLLVLTLLAYLVGKMGDKRNIGFGWAFVFALILGPLFGLIIVLCSKKKDVEFIDMEGGDK